MKAVVNRRYGPPDALTIEDVATPTVGETDVLIRVRAAAVNTLDWGMMSGIPYVLRPMVGLRKPKIFALGVDVAGTIEAIGSKVTQFNPGDAVFGSARGAFAEYARTSQVALARKPANVTFEEAAAVPVAGLTALQGIRKAQLRDGHSLLINGASGGIGTFAVQIAKSLGAEVTGVCSTRNVELVRSLGADHVIDYTQSDFTKGAPRYDVLLDIIGNHSLSASMRAIKPNGTYLMVGAHGGRWISPIDRLIRLMIMSPFRSHKMILATTKRNQDDLNHLAQLMEAGKVRTVIDTCYKFSELREAIAHFGTGHARGKIVISVGT